MSKLIVECDTGEVSDGYHTFNELYAHRCTLFAALMMCNKTVAWKSWKHDDGTSFDGWFIAGLNLPMSDKSIGTVTYHLPSHMWDLLFNIKERDKAPIWDGHSSDDVLKRLHEWLKVLAEEPV